ncbi:hypothetical protein pdam_00011340, partial [Pocillopora damicornis]
QANNCSFFCSQVLWKAYIDFEINLEEYDKTRDLYERLLKRTQHVKVWISFAQFEASTATDESIIQARTVYERASKSLRNAEGKEERVMVLEAWKEFEDEYGDESSQEKIKKKMPRRVKKRRKVQTDDG